MRIARKRVFTFLAFLLGTFYVFSTQFDSVAVASSAVLIFIVLYALVLYCIKQWQGRTLKMIVNDYVEFVQPDVACCIEPHTRGLLVHGELSLFSRIGLNSEGIYLYKQGCYSFRIPWSSVLTWEKDMEFDAIKLTLKGGGDKSFLLPWSSSFEPYLS